MTQVDSLDEQILAALQVNGRLTMKALAEHVGLSSPAMIERVRRLEERGVIAGYRAIIEPGTLGRPLTAVITATVAPAHYEPFLARIHADPAIAECLRVTGEATHLVKVHVEDTAALETLVDELSATGARVVASLVLSAPVPYRAVTPPEGTTAERGRLARRRRRTVGAGGLISGNEQPKRPGRPRGPRRAIEASTG